MRRLLLAALFAAVAQSAYAADPADLPILRGAFREPTPVVHRTIWQGFYVGGQAGYGASNTTYSAYNSDLIERLTANPFVTVLASQAGTSLVWPTLESVTHRSSAFGAFAGYNAQYENVVLGFEGNYMHGTFSSSAFGRNQQYNQSPGSAQTLITTTTSRAALKVTDFASLRVRGGYTMGGFMPYLFAGVGLGSGETSRNVAVSYVVSTNGVVTSGPLTFSLPEDTKQFLYGFSVGGGIDWMLFSGLFLRAEYEYLQFTSSINTNIQTGRVGLGYKF